MPGHTLSGAELAARSRSVVEGAVEIWAQAILGDSVNDAPIEEGTLRGSGHVEDSSSGDVISREISFDTPYAARQHEELTWKHPLGGKAKYLEDNVKARAHDGERLVGAAMRAVARLGGGL